MFYRSVGYIKINFIKSAIVDHYILFFPLVVQGFQFHSVFQGLLLLILILILILIMMILMMILVNLVLGPFIFSLHTYASPTIFPNRASPLHHVLVWTWVSFFSFVRRLFCSSERGRGNIGSSFLFSFLTNLEFEWSTVVPIILEIDWLWLPI